MHFNHLYIISLMISLETVISDKLPTCQPENFGYDFTECDEYGGRWRVSVPSTPNTCTGGAPNAPIRVDKCFTSCDSGQFFNSSSLLCQKCGAGYYSLGGGVHIQSFNSTSLPTGFHINTEPVHHSCVGWHINSNYIESTSINSVGGCVSLISYTIKILKTGKLRFIYQYFIPDDLSSAILFTFHYRNYDESEDISSSSLDTNNIKFPSSTNEQQKWKTMEVKLLKPGLYFFVWKSVTLWHAKNFANTGNIKIRSVNLFDNQTDNHTNYGLIRIKSIYVDGVAYASECTPCESGTFNNKTGAEYCELCPQNTAFAETGAIKCNDCDSQTEYSPRGSSKCLSRPICGENDYYEIIGECDLTNKVQDVKYAWIEPKICRNQNNVLPHADKRECNESTFNVELNQRCNLGMELREDNCHFCGPNKYRNQTLDNCLQCPPSSSPLYALSYKVWQSGKPGDTSLPPYFSAQCARGDNDDGYNECNSQISWQSTIGTKNYIRTTPSALLGSYLILTLNIPGFRKQTGGEISFKFEVECYIGDKCQFLFMESKGKRSQPTTDIIHKWSDSNGIDLFKYRIQQNTSVTFSWIFKRESSFQSNAKLYEVLVTDTSVGGAIECTPCPHGSGLNCVPCPFGQYLVTDESIQHNGNSNRIDRNADKVETDRKSSSTRCKRCPLNFIINSSLSFPIGVYNSCIPCGSSLIDDNGINCYSNCNVIIDNDNYDLSQLKQPLLYKANTLFTAGGTQYYHMFNITLCGQPQQKSTCINNITSFGTTNDETDEEGINSMICRSTIIPDRDQIFATQSVSLGDELIGITRQTTYQNITVHQEFQTTNSDLHFYYLTRLPTVACRSGRRLTLTLRCAPELEENMIISSPKQCPDGTCDGCNFHLLVRTKTAAACRLCRASDYETLVGECVKGFQQIHFVNPKGCIITPDGQITSEVRPCSIIPRQVQILIGLVSCLGIILLTLVVHFWRKNRSLEYKYCKLIENEKTADCCAEDDEEEDDEVDVVVQPKKHKEIGEKGYETIQLTKHDHDMI